MVAGYGPKPPVYVPDLFTPMNMLRDAVEVQSMRALQMFEEAMNPGKPRHLRSVV